MPANTDRAAVFGVDGVDLAVVATLAPITVIDLHDCDRAATHETREPDAVAAGALDPERLDRGQELRAQSLELGVAGPCQPRHRYVAPVGTPSWSIAHSDVNVFVGVDTDDDLGSPAVDRSGMLDMAVLLHRLTTPSGRVGGQDCDGDLRIARPLFGHCPPGQPTSGRCCPTGPTDQRKDTKRPS